MESTPQSLPNHQNQDPRRKSTGRRAATAIVAGAAVLGVAAGAAIKSNEAVIAGAPTAAAEQVTSGPLAYVQSKGRNGRLTEVADSISSRVLQDANQHPERVAFDDSSDGVINNGKGDLTSTFQLGDKQIAFTVSVVENGGRFTFNPNNSSVGVVASQPGEQPGSTQTSNASLSRKGGPAGDGVTPWTAASGMSVGASGNGGQSGIASAESPGMTVTQLQDTEARAQAQMTSFADEAGI